MSDALPVVAQPIVMLFTMNNSLVVKGLHALSDDDVWYQMEGKANPIAWIVGHVVETREQLLTLLGAAAGLGWGGRFKRGSARLDRAEYPSRQDVESAFVASQELVLAAVRALSAERLAEKPPVSFGGAKTWADLLTFFAFHEAYHLGQIGFIRKNVGHAALVG